MVRSLEDNEHLGIRVAVGPDGIRTGDMALQNAVGAAICQNKRDMRTARLALFERDERCKRMGPDQCLHDIDAVLPKDGWPVHDSRQDQ